MAYQVLIIDDEEIVCRGMAQFIKWQEHGFSVAGTVYLAKEGLKFLENHHVDVIFLDIRMPEMTGLEMLKIISAKYLYLWLKQLHITGTGTTQQQLTVPYFQKTEILVPSQEIVTLFTTTVDPIFEKIWANQNENEKLSSLRDTLLPKLMSGELDVSGIDL